MTQAKINELSRAKKDADHETKGTSSKKISQLKINELAAPKRAPFQHFQVHDGSNVSRSRSPLQRTMVPRKQVSNTGHKSAR